MFKYLKTLYQQISNTQPVSKLNLLDLPVDVIEPNNQDEPSIGNHLDAKTLCRLSCVNKGFRALLQEEVEKIKQEKLKELLRAIVRGQRSQAEAILKTHPGLIFKKGDVLVRDVNDSDDYSYRTILNVTPLELAWGAEDVKMCQMIIPFFDRFKDGKKEALAQINKFSGQSSIYDFRPLIEAISADPFIGRKPNEFTKGVLARFRKDFRPGCIKEGKHFNVQFLVQALEIYFYFQNQWGSEKTSLFWCQVIGYIQRSLPACYAQAYCTSILKLKQNELDRSFQLELSDEFYYPLDAKLSHRLGYDYGIKAYETRIADPVSDNRDMYYESGVAWLKKYIDRNQQDLENMKQSLEQSCSGPSNILIHT